MTIANALGSQGGLRQPAAAFAAALWLATAGAATAQGGGRVITPDGVVSSAVAYSRSIGASEQDIRVWEARVRQADALGRPALDARVHAARYEGLEAVSLGPGLTIEEIPGRYGASVGVSQPLYTGGRVASQRDGARLQRAAAERSREEVVSAAVRAALVAYWSWSKSAAAEQSLGSAVRRMEAHAADMRNLHEAGLATDNDQLAAEVLLEQTRLKLQAAESAVQAGRARIAHISGWMPGPEDRPLEAPAAAGPVPEERALVEQACSNRPAIAARELAVRSAAAAVRAARADRRPQVALAARYEEGRPNAMFFPPEDRWDRDAFAGVTAAWSLWDAGLTQGRVAEAVARQEQARLLLLQARDDVTLEVREARIAAADAANRLRVAARAEASARRNLESATDLWKSGLARHSDVLDAESRLTDTQYQVVAARADIAIAWADLQHATGSLPIP